MVQVRLVGTGAAVTSNEAAFAASALPATSTDQNDRVWLPTRDVLTVRPSA